MALGNGTHKLPVRADIRRAIGKDVGDTVVISLEERIDAHATAGSSNKPDLLVSHDISMPERALP